MLPLAWLLPLLWGARGWQAEGPSRGVPLRLSLALPPGSPAPGEAYALRVQAAVAVQEGLCALVPCSFSYPRQGWNESAPVHGRWYRKGAQDVLVATSERKESKRKGRGSFSLLGDPQANNCSLSIRDARKKDSGDYFFQVEIGRLEKHSYRNNSITVTVTALTRAPHIRILEPLESGRRSRLTCSGPQTCGLGAPRTVSWSGAALGSPGSRAGPGSASEIALTPGPQDHGTNLTCRVTFPRAGPAVETTITLNVSYAPQDLTVRVFRGNCTELKHLGNGSALPVLEGEPLHIICVADSNPPARLSWVQGSRALSPSRPSDPGVLELPRVELGDDGKYTCLAENALGSAQLSLHLSVLYPLQLLGPSCSWEAEGLLCSCSARARPVPSLRWRLGDRLVEANGSRAPATATSSSAGPWAHSNLSLRGGLGPGLTLSCEARNALGEQRVAVLLLPGKPESRAGVVLGAIGGAGTMALISLSLCLAFFCIVKARRKQAAGKPEGTDDEDPVMGTVAWGSRRKPWPDASPDQEPPSGDGVLPGEEQTLHYASLSFHRMKSWEPEGPRATATEYSEIKSRQTNKDLPRPQSWPEESQPVWGERRSQGLTDEA